MSIPAILERDRPPEASAAQGLPFDTLPSGRGAVYVVGGTRIEGDVRLAVDWVVVDRDDDSRETVAVPTQRVLSVVFAP